MHIPALIATDVDGTLLTPLESMTRRTVDVLARMRARGVPLVLVSGRPPRFIPPIAAPAEIDGYAVCANGAALYDIGRDRVLRSQDLSPTQLHDIAEALATVLPSARLAAERAGHEVHEGRLVPIAVESDFVNPWGDDAIAQHVTRAEVLGSPAIKLLASDHTMTSDAMTVAARSVLGAAVTVTFSSSAGLIEISQAAITKATGLAEVVSWYGIDPVDVLAFGDMPNDIDMLQWAGHGVAVANAHPSVRDVAAEITGPNTEDGVAAVLERWF